MASVPVGQRGIFCNAPIYVVNNVKLTSIPIPYLNFNTVT